MPSARRASLRAHLKPRHKLWLNWDGAFLMGPRYLRFLDAVERSGTIRAAGQEVGWSYRTCLNRIREMERVLGAKVLVTKRGGASRGGARLSPAARDRKSTRLNSSHSSISYAVFCLKKKKKKTKNTKNKTKKKKNKT